MAWAPARRWESLLPRTACWPASGGRAWARARRPPRTQTTGAASEPISGCHWICPSRDWQCARRRRRVKPWTLSRARAAAPRACSTRSPLRQCRAHNSGFHALGCDSGVT